MKLAKETLFGGGSRHIVLQILELKLDAVSQVSHCARCTLETPTAKQIHCITSDGHMRLRVLLYLCSKLFGCCQP